jgi:lipoyl(octanoyl) transferase
MRTVSGPSLREREAAPEGLSLFDGTRKLFASLDIYYDASPRSAAMNMALDEALLEQAPVPSIRFYRWDHPALSFGYFGKFADVAGHGTQREVVRRWTGGGIVFHGDDLTYSIVIPACDPAFRESSMTIYECVHRAIRDALRAVGQRAELAAVEAVCDHRNASSSPVVDGSYSHCFANPVRADVMVAGRKVAGAAQRRTRIGLLHQGSIQNAVLNRDFAARFAMGLASERNERKIRASIVNRASHLAPQRYGSDVWLQRR